MDPPQVQFCVSPPIELLYILSKFSRVEQKSDTHAMFPLWEGGTLCKHMLCKDKCAGQGLVQLQRFRGG